MDRRFLFGSLVVLALARPAAAADVTIFVGGDPAKAKAAAALVSGKWDDTLSKGLEDAAAALEGGEELSVLVKIACGNHDGGGKGFYAVPALNNVKASLRLEGGWNEGFTRRDPFKTPSKIVTIPKRPQALLGFHSGSGANVDKLKSLSIDGLLFDTQKSNAYDEAGNLVAVKSSGFTIIDFNSMLLDVLVVQNCIFLNAPGGAFQTLVRAQTDRSEVFIRNSIFLNCVAPLKMDPVREATGKIQMKRMVLDHCSFLMSWAFGGNASGNNPAAVELGPREAAKEFVITNNLFYSNFGGAIFCVTKQNPKMTVKGNLFAGNGFLSGTSSMGATAMIVDGGEERIAQPADNLAEVKNVIDGEGNEMQTPGIPLALAEPSPVDEKKVKAEKSWDDEVKRILGKNDFADGKPRVKSFAPRKDYDPLNPPLPLRPAARKFGASPELVK